MDDAADGVWAHIAAHSPLPELDEIKQTIGIKIIEQNLVFFCYCILANYFTLKLLLTELMERNKCNKIHNI
jgi:hypothetical protein